MTGLRFPHHVVADTIARALAEDLGGAGDLTSALTVPAGATAQGAIVARAAGVVAGLPLATACFRHLDEAVKVVPDAADGEPVAAGAVLAHLDGPAHPILAGERVALNLLGHLSGVASATRAFVDAVAGTEAQIIDTRKTTPGLRALEKYAVRCGGGANHRFGLDDAVLIKDNHIAVAGGVGPAVAAARTGAGHMVKVEVELDRIDQIDEALAAGADIILLDNMNVATLRRAVEHVAGRAITEASGGVTLATVGAIAATGVDLISVGRITHSAPALDVALDFDIHAP